MQTVYIRVLDLNQTIAITCEPDTYQIYHTLCQKIREFLNVEANHPIQLLREDQMWLCTIS